MKLDYIRENSINLIKRKNNNSNLLKLKIFQLF